MRFARVVAEFLVWWAITVSGWMISLSAAPLQEWLVAVGCGAICAAAACAARRRALQASWRLKPRWLLPLAAVPLIAITDAVQVLTAVIRPGHGGGSFETVRTGALDDGPEARSRRAIATWLMSVTPGSYVLDADPETGDLLVHRLARRGPDMAKLVEKS